MSFLWTIGNPTLSYPEDFYPMLYYTAAFAVGHQVLQRLVYKPLSDKYITNKSLQHADSGVNVNSKSSTTSTSTKKATQKHGENLSFKFQNSLWRLTFFGVLWMVGVFVATQEEWMFEPHNWFSNPPLKMSTLVKHYYCAEFGNYVYAIISMLFLEPRQKDFVQMLSHHFVTMGLIWMSYLWGYHRAGSVILLIHDTADPLLELAKTTLYLGKENLANGLFVLFAFAFISLRCFLYPFKVVSQVLASKEFMPDGVYEFANILLCVLVVLNVFWAAMIVKLIVVSMRGGVKGDPRDHDAVGVDGSVVPVTDTAVTAGDDGHAKRE